MIKGLKSEDIKKAFCLMARVCSNSPKRWQGLGEMRGFDTKLAQGKESLAVARA